MTLYTPSPAKIHAADFVSGPILVAKFQDLLLVFDPCQLAQSCAREIYKVSRHDPVPLSSDVDTHYLEKQTCQKILEKFFVKYNTV